MNTIYKPAASGQVGNGKAALIIDTRGKNPSKIEVLDKNGKVIDTMRDSGSREGSTLKFIGNQAGSSYGEGATIRITGGDGSIGNLNLAHGGSGVGGDLDFGNLGQYEGGTSLGAYEHGGSGGGGGTFQGIGVNPKATGKIPKGYEPSSAGPYGYIPANMEKKYPKPQRATPATSATTPYERTPYEKVAAPAGDIKAETTPYAGGEQAADVNYQGNLSAKDTAYNEGVTADRANYTGDVQLKNEQYKFSDPSTFAKDYSAGVTDRVTSNFNTAQGMGLEAMNTELQGLTGFASGAAALKRQQTSIDNIVNQAMRSQQVEQATPGLTSTLAAQMQRANAYATGTLPDSVQNSLLEQGIRSSAADQAAAGGFGARSSVARKASDLMSAAQRLQIAQYGEGLIGSSATLSNQLLMAPTEYSNAGNQINVMPTTSAAQNALSQQGMLNAANVVTAETGLASTTQQNQFNTTANINQNATAAQLAVNQAQFANTSAISQNQFAANLAVNQAQYGAGLRQQTGLANLQAGINQAQFGAQLQQSNNQFNTNARINQTQFGAQLAQNNSQFNAQLGVNQAQFGANFASNQNQFASTFANNQAQFQAQLTQNNNQFNAANQQQANLFNASTTNEFNLNKFNYQVGYAGAVAGAFQTNANTELQLALANQYDSIYGSAQGGAQNSSMISSILGSLGSIAGIIKGISGLVNTPNTNTTTETPSIVPDITTDIPTVGGNFADTTGVTSSNNPTFDFNNPGASVGTTVGTGMDLGMPSFSLG